MEPIREVNCYPISIADDSDEIENWVRSIKGEQTDDISAYVARKVEKYLNDQLKRISENTSQDPIMLPIMVVQHDDFTIPKMIVEIFYQHFGIFSEIRLHSEIDFKVDNDSPPSISIPLSFMPPETFSNCNHADCLSIIVQEIDREKFSEQFILEPLLKMLPHSIQLPPEKGVDDTSKQQKYREAITNHDDCDLTFEVNGKSIKAHRNIMKFSDAKEYFSNYPVDRIEKIDFSSEEVFIIFILCLYTENYSHLQNLSLEKLFQIHQLARYFQSKKLEQYSTSYIIQCIGSDKTSWDDFQKVLHEKYQQNEYTSIVTYSFVHKLNQCQFPEDFHTALACAEEMKNTVMIQACCIAAQQKPEFIPTFQKILSKNNWSIFLEVASNCRYRRIIKIIHQFVHANQSITDGKDSDELLKEFTVISPKGDKKKEITESGSSWLPSISSWWS